MISTDRTTDRTTDPQPRKAVHTWSLFRTLGRYIAPGSMPSGDLPESEGNGVTLLDLAGELARHGYRSAQLCHFYFPSREPAYLTEVRTAFDDAGVEIECLLIDDGDLTHPTAADSQQEWISGWLEVADQLGAPRARVIAGKQSPTTTTLRDSATRLRRLADAHPGVRLVTENWHALLPNAASVLELLDWTDGRVGFLVDLGNWRGPGKYAELTAVADRAETCQAKIMADPGGELDADDYRASLRILRDAAYAGPLALVYDGPDPDEWRRLDDAYALVHEVFATPTNP